MNKFRRVVLDNNLVVSRMISSRGVAVRAFDLAYGNCVLLTSAPIVEELRGVAERSRFDRYVGLSARREFIDRYVAAAKSISIQHEVTECRDPKDNKFLELALSGAADAIVTGDGDLLCLNPWRGVAIVSPAEYLAQAE